MSAKMSFLFAILGTAVSAAAAPSIVSGVTVAQDADSHAVWVEYTLSGTEKAIVTFDAATNGVAVTDAALMSVAGDICRIVSPGARKFVWCPDGAMPNTDLSANGLEITLKAWALDNPPPYMVVDLEHGTNLAFYASSNSVPLGVTDRLYKTRKLVMRRIPAKNIVWRMGGDSATWHKVKLTADYYIGIYEMTRGQYTRATGLADPSQGPDTTEPTECRPVEYIAKYNAAYYLRGDSMAAGSIAGGGPEAFNTNGSAYLAPLRALTGLAFDLPTEAQWEYACRAGTGTKYCWGNGTSAYVQYAWAGVNAAVTVNGESVNVSHEVGMLLPNAWGLYDMHGNVGEFCMDWKIGDYGLSSGSIADAEEITVNPYGGARTASSESRIYRGSNFDTNIGKNTHMSYYRAGSNNGGAKTGFRLCCPATIPDFE